MENVRIGNREVLVGSERDGPAREGGVLAEHFIVWLEGRVGTDCNDRTGEVVAGDGRVHADRGMLDVGGVDAGVFDADKGLGALRGVRLPDFLHGRTRGGEKDDFPGLVCHDVKNRSSVGCLNAADPVEKGVSIGMLGWNESDPD